MLPARLVDAFSSVPDPRVERTRLHGLVDILVIALLAVINGSTGWKDMELFARGRLTWLRTFLALPNGVPSEDTFRRVFEALDSKAFSDSLTLLLEDLVADLQGKVVAIDGKTLRGSLDRRRGKSALHVVSAWVTELGLSLGQVCVEDKSNEIVAIPALLNTLDIRGATVTIDAMGCQKAIAETIVDAGVDYILAVKDNHPKLHAAIASVFSDIPGQQDKSRVEEKHVTEEKAHGRIEHRCVRITRQIDGIKNIEAWRGVTSILEVERTRTVAGKTSFERAYFISSLAIDASSMGDRIRSHWGIENSLHWVLDVTYGEDKSLIRDRTAAANLTALRKLSMALLKRTPGFGAKSVAQRRKLAGWVPDYAFDVLAMISAK